MKRISKILHISSILIAQQESIDVGEEGTLGEPLSNFTEFHFSVDGVSCNSMEGFLQSLKFNDPEQQKAICQLVGKKAKFKGKKKKWYIDQKLYWQGEELNRHGSEYQKLIDKAYDALGRNRKFQEALAKTGDNELTHKIGKEDPQRTILTTQEFLTQLYKLRRRAKLLTASTNLNEIDKIVQKAKKDEIPTGYVFRIMDQKEWDNISQDRTYSGSFWSSDITEYIKNMDENNILAVIKDKGSPSYRGLIPQEDIKKPHEELIQKYHHYMLYKADKKDILAAYRIIDGKRTRVANIENKPLTLDQARFTKEKFEDVVKHIGTDNIEVISEKDDPTKYAKLNKLYKDNPADQTTYRSPSFVTGVSSFKNIGGKVVLIFRDAQVDDYFIVAPKGFLQTLEQPKQSRVDFIASSLTANRLEDMAKERQKKFDDFYKKHGLSADQEPKDMAIMVPGINGKYTIISPSTKHKGKWQLTYFDEKGPWGDQTHNNLHEALKETSLQNLNKAEVMKGQSARLQVASLALYYMGMKIASEWHELPESDELDSLLWAIYELEFKYSKMKNNSHKWEGNPERYNNTLKKMGSKILEVAQGIANQLIPVYKNWLNSHAITKPKQWAKARYDENVDSELEEDMYAMLTHEYKRYGSGNIDKEIAKETIKNIKELPTLEQFLEEFSIDERIRLEEEEDEYEKEEFDNLMEALDDPENTWENLIDSYGVDEFIGVFVKGNLAAELYPFWYEKIVFPVWYKHWKTKGIDATRKRVEQRYKELKQLTSGSVSDPAKVATMVNLAIQESHQTGEMMDYISEHHGIDYNILTELSNVNTTDWEKELDTMGLKTANIKTANKEYKNAGSTVDGLKVRSEIPNMSSIESSFNDYEILKGIKEIPMSELGGPKSVFYATDDFNKSKKLAEQIKSSGEINPLIIAIDEEGPYILEGAHRYVALYYLDKKSFPALVVLDKDEQSNSKTASEEEEEKIQYPTLDEFLKSPIKNSDLDIPGFDRFYARKGPYYVDGKIYPKVLQLANITATNPGQGEFSKLTEQLKKLNMPIIIESIQNPRFPRKLEELGFKQVNKNSGLHYFWEPNLKTATSKRAPFGKAGGWITHNGEVAPVAFSYDHEVSGLKFARSRNYFKDYNPKEYKDLLNMGWIIVKFDNTTPSIPITIDYYEANVSPKAKKTMKDWLIESDEDKVYLLDSTIPKEDAIERL